MMDVWILWRVSNPETMIARRAPTSWNHLPRIGDTLFLAFAPQPASGGGAPDKYGAAEIVAVSKIGVDLFREVVAVTFTQDAIELEVRDADTVTEAGVKALLAAGWYRRY